MHYHKNVYVRLDLELDISCATTVFVDKENSKLLAGQLQMTWNGVTKVSYGQQTTRYTHCLLWLIEDNPRSPIIYESITHRFLLLMLRRRRNSKRRRTTKNIIHQCRGSQRWSKSAEVVVVGRWPQWPAKPPIDDCPSWADVVRTVVQGTKTAVCRVRGALNRNPFGSIQYTEGRIGRDFLGFSQIQMN